MDELLSDEDFANDLEQAAPLIDDTEIESGESSLAHTSPIFEADEKVQLEDTSPLDLSSTRPIDESTSDETLNLNDNPLSKSQSKSKSSPGFRAAVGRPEPFRSSGMANPTDVALTQSENLRLAQQRILDLEKELERLREQNEELGSAGETLRRRSDELLSENEELRRRIDHEISTSNQEKDILKNSKDLLRREVEELKQKNSELEIRISSNLQRVRVRERELENRLELMKVESKALVRSKDEMVLDLKRQMDQLNLELNNYRVKSQDLNKQISERQEMLRRTVKALRLALSMLEGEEESPPLKKVK